MKKLLITLLTLIVVGALQAETITQSDVFGGTPNYSKDFTFNLFDSTLGSLTSITWTLYSTVSGGSLGVDNDGAAPASVDVELGADSILNANAGLGLFGITVNLKNTDSFNLTEDIEGLVGYQNTGAADTAYLAGGLLNDSDVTSILSVFYAAYQADGGGLLDDVTVNVAQILDFGGVGGVAGTFSPVSSSGTLELTYTYAPVPEPATASMMIFAGVIALLVRRHFHD